MLPKSRRAHRAKRSKRNASKWMERLLLARGVLVKEPSVAGVRTKIRRATSTIGGAQPSIIHPFGIASRPRGRAGPFGISSLVFFERARAEAARSGCPDFLVYHQNACFALRATITLRQPLTALSLSALMPKAKQPTSSTGTGHRRTNSDG